MAIANDNDRREESEALDLPCPPHVRFPKPSTTFPSFKTIVFANPGQRSVVPVGPSKSRCVRTERVPVGHDDPVARQSHQSFNKTGRCEAAHTTIDPEYRI
jgi:hypothetical protein